MFKESSTTFHIPVDMLEQEYLRRILKAHVYDVAKETPLQQAKLLSARTENKILLKREDLQSVFSFKLRGAYNKMANLTPEERARGVIAASAGNHAQGVALAASKLGCRAVIVMPITAPAHKINTDRVAASDAEELQANEGLTAAPPFDDPDVIAGQGTVGMEIIRQAQNANGNIDAIFVPVGGGGLLAGVAVYVKALYPNIKVFGVQTYDSDSMNQSLKNGERTLVPDVGLFSDGTAVKLVGKETYELCKNFVDGIVLVDTDEVCAAICEEAEAFLINNVTCADLYAVAVVCTDPVDSQLLPLGVALGAVDTQNIRTYVNKSRNTLCVISCVDTCAYYITLLAVEKRVLVFLMLLIVLSEYEVHKNAVIVNYGERIELMLPDYIVCFLKRCACWSGDELFKRSHECRYLSVGSHS